MPGDIYIQAGCGPDNDTDDNMHYIFDNLPLAAIIAGICILMIYPYLGAGVLLAVLCMEAGQYLLMAMCILVCIGLHIVMGKRIRPVKGAVPPSAASRRAERKKHKAAQQSDAEQNTKE